MNIKIEITSIFIGVIIGAALIILQIHFYRRRKQKHQENMHYTRFLLAKLREMQDILSQYRQDYTDSTLKTVISAVGSNRRGNMNCVGVPNQRLRILVRFYAPKLAASLTKLEKTCQDYDNMLEHCVNLETEIEDVKKGKLYDLYNKQLNLNQAIADMQSEVIALAGDKTYLEQLERIPLAKAANKRMQRSAAI